MRIHRQLLPPKFPKPFIKSFLLYAAGGYVPFSSAAALIVQPMPPHRYFCGRLYFRLPIFILTFRRRKMLQIFFSQREIFLFCGFSRNERARFCIQYIKPRLRAAQNPAAHVRRASFHAHLLAMRREVCYNIKAKRVILSFIVRRIVGITIDMRGRRHPFGPHFRVRINTFFSRIFPRREIRWRFLWKGKSFSLPATSLFWRYW